MKLMLDEVRSLIDKVLEKYGYNAIEREKISEVILYATLRGSSQGLPKLFGWRIEKGSDAKDPDMEMSSSNVIRYDANINNHMYVCSIALDKLLEVMKNNGIATVGIYNTDNSSGALGYYTNKLAQNGFVGIMFSSSDPVGAITPTGDKNGVFGSNPLSISFPYDDNQITLDMSTAKYTWGDLVNASVKSETLESGFAFDKDGKETTDPKKVMDDGMVASFDGTYKGLGLAFMIQILAGGLIGSVYKQDENCGYGSLIIAIDPEQLGGRKFMEDQIKTLISAYKKEGGDGTLFPGERGNHMMQKFLKEGSIEIDDDLYQKIKDKLKD